MVVAQAVEATMYSALPAPLPHPSMRWYFLQYAVVCWWTFLKSRIRGVWAFSPVEDAIQTLDRQQRGNLVAGNGGAACALGVRLVSYP